jgi:hypothetical protein
MVVLLAAIAVWKHHVNLHVKLSIGTNAGEAPPYVGQ